MSRDLGVDLGVVGVRRVEQDPVNLRVGHPVGGVLQEILVSEGETVPGPSGQATRIAGTDTYEWLGGGFFVVHRVDVRFGDEHVEAIEIIGYDAASGTYPTHAFDSQGSASTYRMRERDGTWTITGGTERSTLAPDGAGMRASWERTDDGRTWLPWMEIRLTRASEGEG